MGIISDAAVSPGDLARRQADTERAITEVRTARRSEHTSVTSGDFRIREGARLVITDEGDLIIQGGALRLQTADGDDLVFFGDVVADDETSRGWFYRFDPASGAGSAFTLQGAPSAQFWSLRDQAGNIIASNDADSGEGLARPWLPYDLVATEDAEISPPSAWPSTTATTAGTVLLAKVVPIQHPVIRIGANVLTSGGGTGHWRFKVQSATTTTVLVSDETGFASHDVEVPGWGDDIRFGDQVVLGLEAWVTDGGTRAFVQYDRLYGRQS